MGNCVKCSLESARRAQCLGELRRRSRAAALGRCPAGPLIVRVQSTYSCWGAWSRPPFRRSPADPPTGQELTVDTRHGLWSNNTRGLQEFGNLIQKNKIYSKRALDGRREGRLGALFCVVHSCPGCPNKPPSETPSGLS